MVVFGIGSWLAANWVLERWGLEPLFLIFRDQWLTFTYVSAALLLLARWPPLLSRLAPMANAGRMAGLIRGGAAPVRDGSLDL